jgi:hypothetical protein
MGMRATDVSKAASLMGRRSYSARLKRFGIERIREIARENGKQHKKAAKKENPK